MNRGGGRDALANLGDGSDFQFEDEGQRKDAALAQNDHNLALAGLVLGKPTIDTIVLVVSLADISADCVALSRQPHC